MSEKAQFGSKIGLIAATVGSAVGLGNVWRFPAETQANGGAAFLLIYVCCVFLLGIPVMLSEFALGRGGRADAAGAFMNIKPGNKWWMVGGLAILASYIILCFYMVVAGWTFEYLWQSITGGLYDSVNVADAQFKIKMSEYIEQNINPLIYTYIMIVVNLVVLLFGVRKGIERISNILMPMLFVLLLIFCCVSLSLPKAGEGLEFFLNPDFSKITPGIIINALGQAFFSLSLGMGILITYSSYYPKDTRLSRTAVTISMCDLLVAFLMGIIIFPIVKSFGLDNQGLEGTTLIFVTLPEVFTQMPMTQMWSILFFLFLTVAALTSTISIAEVSVAFLQNRLKLSRLKSCLIVILPLFFFSSVCSLSQGILNDFKIAGLNIFDLFDMLATNIMLPIGSIFVCIFVGWVAPKQFLQNELTNYGAIKSRIFNLLLFIIRFVAPILIALILVFKFI